MTHQRSQSSSTGHHDTAPGRELTRPRALSARLTVYPAAGEPFAVRCAGTVRVGRADDAEVPLDDHRASRLHAEILRRRDGAVWEIRDLDSRNGTFLNGNRVSASSLRNGDVLRVGDSVAIFETGTIDASLGSEVRSSASIMLEFELADAAGDDLPVLLLGPTGTGKSWLAERIAEKSARRGPFVHVNCAELPPTLVESELFGAVRGAFTGANADRRGLIESANGGTVFLDEIATLSPDLQAKLLTVIEHGLVRRVGAQQPTRIDVRYLAATNIDVREAIRSGVFREDLYFRLAVHEIRIPPLRERRADILPLFIEALGAEGEGVLTAEAREALLCYEWPGNIRELLNVARVCASARFAKIDYTALPVRIQRPLSKRAPEAAGSGRLRGDRPTLEQITAALADCGGNVSATARLLGEHRTQIVRWLRHYGLDRP